MQIKGLSVKETLDNIKIKFLDRKDEWINSLSEKSNWKDLYNSQIKILELFFDNYIKTQIH